ncbi:MAG: molecular chaperone [Synechocystis sp.]
MKPSWLFPSTVIFWSISHLQILPSWAALFFTLLPMESFFAPVGPGSTQAFQITNNSKDAPLAVEIYITNRSHDLNGKETNHRDGVDDDFLVYPPQMQLQPGQVQTVRVSWLGDGAPQQELAFRLIAQQMPGSGDTTLDQQDGKTISLTTLIRYAASVYITPPGAKANILVESAKAISNNELELILHNQGTAHRILRENVTYTFTPKAQPDKAITIPLDIPITNLLAGDRRRFVVPWPKELPVGDINATINLGQ